MPLTESKLQALHGKRIKSSRVISDGRGLSVRHSKNGELTFYFRFRMEDKQTNMAFGTYPELDLESARGKVVEFKRMLANDEDPRGVKAKPEKIDIESLKDEWLAKKVPTLKEKTRLNYEAVANKYFLNSMFKLDVQTAKREDWVTYFDRVVEMSSPVNAGNVLRLLKTVLKWCIERSLIDGSAALDLTIKSVGAKAAVGQRNLQMHEVGLLWHFVNRSRATPAVKACTKLLLIFGARNSEIRESTYSEFDLERGVWTLPAARSKTGKEIRRPIPQKAKFIIEELSETYGDSGYLIPGAHRGTFVSCHALNRYVRRIRIQMCDVEKSVEAFTPHDFRRTLSTRLSEREVLPHVTEKMLGHELGGIMAVYNKHDWIDDQREAYEMWCKMISEATQTELSRLDAM